MNAVITVILPIKVFFLELKDDKSGIHSCLQESLSINEQLSEKLKNLPCKICVPGISVQVQHMRCIYSLLFVRMSSVRRTCEKGLGS